MEKDFCKIRGCFYSSLIFGCIWKITVSNNFICCLCLCVYELRLQPTMTVMETVWNNHRMQQSVSNAFLEEFQLNKTLQWKGNCGSHQKSRS